MAERPDFPKMEEEVLAFWKEQEIFRKTLEKPAPRGNFVFFEGPPTANGRAGIHHVESRAYKDVIPRYKTMRGYFVERKAGWDTHGLPVEIEVEKNLGISGKQQIESLKATPRESIAYFNELCKQSVWTYLEDWNALTERIGFWLDLEHPYITYQNEYIESLWWIVKQIADRGLLYKDYKVVPYCARCGTPLSSHELALGYDEVEDPSIYVKFRVTKMTSPPQPSPLEGKGKGEGAPTYFLIWTTTPWTLPGNVALAVHPEVEYVKVEPRTQNSELSREYLILAKARLGVLEGEYEVVEEFTGKELEGWEYEPLYQFVDYGSPSSPTASAPEAQTSSGTKPFTVALADFVSIEDGTGIVHTAVMYGAEDFELGQKIGLPKKHLVNLRGEFIQEVEPWAGMFVKDADPKIIEELRSRGLLYRQEQIRHTYPFCWRCKTPLLYYAKESWFVRMSALRDELIRANETVNWVPDYIKEGRFGEWLREVKDWAFSRERYWGTPLPIWICEGCGAQKVVGGFDDFSKSASKNSYWLLRHSEATHNTKGIVSGDPNAPYQLTEFGKQQTREIIGELKKTGLDLIFASPYQRTRETADMIGSALGIPVTYVDDLGDIKFGEFEGKSIEEWRSRYPRRKRFKEAPAGGETYAEVLRRTVRSLRKIDSENQGKRILIVSHGDPLFLLDCATRGLSEDMMVRSKDTYRFNSGEPRKLVLRQLPFRDDGFVDPHRPFVDEVMFSCEKCGGAMRRTPEVIDVWFDSGSMPFAQWHYPFEEQQKIDRGDAFPGDFIAEAIDQTRGWFYTLLAISTLLGRGAPYKNVICLGHVLDKEGKKMSKSIGNVVDPWEMVQRYGADTVRWYMYTTNQPGDAKLFDEVELDAVRKRVFMILWNVLAFWKLYAGENPEPTLRRGSGQVNQNPVVRHVMDEWMLARLNTLTKTLTESLDVYEVTQAGRAITDFIDDLSTWYVRRSRERFKAGSTEAVATLTHVLLTLSKLMAPFTPFFAEKLYREVCQLSVVSCHLSVHLEPWPEPGPIDDTLIGEMEVVRCAAELGHAIRDEQKIRVRQPLAELELESPKQKIRSEPLEILADELNVKKVHLVDHVEERNGYAARAGAGLTVALDLTMSLELKREGWLREIIRHVNDLRKEAKLTIRDRITIYYNTSDTELQSLFSSFESEIKKGALADTLQAGRGGSGKELTLEEKTLWLGIERCGIL